jgi:UDP-N-acetylbacillosamine N-acetyltransferase
MNTDLVIWGASGHASVVADIVRCQGHYTVAGFLDDRQASRAGELFCGAPVLGGRDRLPDLLARGINRMLVGIGDCAGRLACARAAAQQGFTFPVAVHPAATVAADATLGPGTIIMAGAVVNPGARLGAHCIVNTCASVDHHNILEDGVHVAPGAHLAGGVRVGEGAWIGLGALVRENVHIGAGCLVGAGALVLDSLEAGVVAWGQPARPVQKTDAGSEKRS